MMIVNLTMKTGFLSKTRNREQADFSEDKVAAG
jgi:hypothetical protein